ncbi:MAG: hypothetical protein ACREQF_00735, partial [Candidatus Binataceae bacterium]
MNAQRDNSHRRIRALRLGIVVAVVSALAAAWTGAGAGDEPTVADPLPGYAEIVEGVPAVVERSAVLHFGEAAEEEARRPAVQVAPRVIHPPLPAPSDLPVPPEALTVESRLRSPPSANISLEPLVPSPPLAANFQALPDSNTSIPPDTNGTVGPNHLMVALNTQVRVQNRVGATISTMTLDAFWSAVAPDAFDPKLLYDPFNNRWIFVSASQAFSANSSVLVGVSQTNDPTGPWNLFAVDADAIGSIWADFPSVGFNSKWIVVSVNMFTIGGSFNRSRLFVFDKSALYAGALAGVVLDDLTGGFTQVPATTFDNTVGTLFLLEDWNGNFSGSGFLRLSTITGAVNAPVLTLAVDFPSVPNPWSDFPPGGADFAPQSGTASKIQNGDARMLSCMYRNGSLWAAHGVF